jgi:hypothetical protein
MLCDLFAAHADQLADGAVNIATRAVSIADDAVGHAVSMVGLAICAVSFVVAVVTIVPCAGLFAERAVCGAIEAVNDGNKAEQIFLHSFLLVRSSCVAPNNYE